MKNLFLTLITFNYFSISYSQTEKILGDFTKVTVFDKISVKLIPSSENKIIYTGKFENEAETIITNNELKIRLPLGSFLQGDDLVAKVYFKTLEAVEANEGSYLSTDDQIKAVDFTILAKEGAQIKLNLETQHTLIKASQGGEIKVTGITNILNIITNTGGKVEAEKYQAKQVNVSVNAGGSADVFATELVDAKTRAGGTITIFGNPKQVNTKKVLGGTIVVKK